jgi:hypothetical protein
VVTETSAWPVFALFGTSTVRPVVLGDDAVTPPAVVEQGFTAAAVSWSGVAVVLLFGGGGGGKVDAAAPAGVEAAAAEAEPAEPVVAGAR